MDPIPEEPQPDVSPFAGLEYPVAINGGASRPHDSAAVGKLAISIRDLTGADGITALSAAILLDQGRASEALDLLAAAASTHAVEVEARKRRAQEKAANR